MPTVLCYSVDTLNVKEMQTYFSRLSFLANMRVNICSNVLRSFFRSPWCFLFCSIFLCCALKFCVGGHSKCFEADDGSQRSKRIYVRIYMQFCLQYSFFCESGDLKFIIKQISCRVTVINPDIYRQEYFTGYELWKVKILCFHHFLS